MTKRLGDEAGRLLLAVAVVATVVAFLLGLYAVLNNRDRLLTSISFCISFLSFVLCTLATFPSVKGRLRTTARPVALVVTTLLALYLVPLAWLLVQKPVVDIGVSLPFRGPDRADAIAIYKAIGHAVDTETSGTWKVGDVTVRLLPFDDSQMEHNQVRLVDGREGRDDPEDFGVITSDAQVAGVIGPFNSGVAVYEIPATAKASLAMISPSTTADCLATLSNLKQDAFDECLFDSVDRKDRTFLRMACADTLRARALADHFRSQGVGASAAIFEDGTFFGRSFAKRLQEAWLDRFGRRVPISELSSDPQEDLRKLTTVPELVLFAGTGPQPIALHEAMARTPGYANTTLAAAATIMRGGVADASSKGDIYAVSPFASFSDRPEFTRFWADYRNDPSGPPEPTPYSASAYDATRILVRAISLALQHAAPPVSRLDLTLQAERFRREVLHDIRVVAPRYDGVTGTFQFDANGEATDLGHEPSATIYRHEQGIDNGWRDLGSVSER